MVKLHLTVEKAGYTRFSKVFDIEKSTKKTVYLSPVLLPEIPPEKSVIGPFPSGWPEKLRPLWEDLDKALYSKNKEAVLAVLRAFRDAEMSPQAALGGLMGIVEVVGAILAVVGTYAFTKFIQEEALQTYSMAIFSSMQAKQWDLASKAVIREEEFLDVIEKPSFMETLLGAASKETKHTAGEKILSLIAFMSQPALAFIATLAKSRIDKRDIPIVNNIYTLQQFIRATRSNLEIFKEIIARQVPPEFGFSVSTFDELKEKIAKGEDISSILPPPEAPKWLTDELKKYKDDLKSSYFTVKDRIELKNVELADEALATFATKVDDFRNYIENRRDDLTRYRLIDDAEASLASYSDALTTFSAAIEELAAAPPEEVPAEIPPPTPAPPKEEVGTLSVTSFPSAEVYVAGELKAESTPATLELTPGFYEVTLKAPDFEEETRPAIIKAGETTALAVTLKPVSAPEVAPPEVAPPTEVYAPPEVITPISPIAPYVPPAPEMAPFVPPPLPEKPLPKAPPTVKKSLVVDIETTGELPWESRIICIGFKDPSYPDEEPVVILKDDEKEMLQDFLTFFKEGGYTEFIGYNVAFDFRFLFTRALYYRLPCAELASANLRDIMQILAQVKEAFVYGKPKAGKLNDWAKFLLSKRKTLTYEQLLKAWKNKQYEVIKAYNANDVQLEFAIWSLIQYCQQTSITASHSPFSPAEETTVTASCPTCLSEVEVKPGIREHTCEVCGTTFKV